jgi:hypothetical protein
MPSTFRRSKASEDDLRKLASINGVLELFSHAVAFGRKLGFTLDFATEHVALSRPKGTGWIVLKPKQSSALAGLVIGCAPGIVPPSGPGIAPAPIRLFNYSFYYVCDRDMLEGCLKAAKDPSPV